MTLLDRYISRSILAATGVVALVIASLMALIVFIDQADDIGRGSYGFLQVLLYTAYLLPKRMEMAMPVVALLGSLLALGGLAAGSELVVVRSAGVSMRRMAVSVSIAGIALALLAVVIGEYLVPNGVRQADDLRDQSLHGEVRTSIDDGLWLRQGNDMLRIDSTLPGGRIDGLSVYVFGKGGQLEMTLKAPSARVEHDSLVIDHPKVTRLSTESATTSAPAQLRLPIAIDPDVIKLAVTDPTELSSYGLWRYIDYLDTNDINDSDYRLELWRNIVAPFTVWTLVVFALPFAFGSLRSASAGQRLLMGGLAGLIFFLVNEIVASTGPVYGVPPWLAASLPTLLLAAGTLWWMRRLD